jgi:hypothetical protein
MNYRNEARVKNQQRGRKMDNSVIDDFTAERQRFDRMMLGIHTSMPGIIESFDSATNLVSVKPAIKMKIAKPGETVSFLDLPVIRNVPICLAQSKQAGLYITVPIKTGDECLLVFSERSIDNFVKSGGVSFPAEGNKQVSPRHHDITDAICIPGVFTVPTALSSWNQDAIEVRNTAGTVKLSISSSKVTITGDLEVTGKVDVVGDVKAGTISLKTHIHGGVMTGLASTAVPTP